ncbi:hypothetical protein QOZ67_31000, partial [Pseudomonas aeruginosa]|uniref:hypothetical protein n=1 Tax=Pseudomonas aeruginosa TaxID=287 RepID=UPI00345ACAA2
VKRTILIQREDDSLKKEGSQFIQQQSFLLQARKKTRNPKASVPLPVTDSFLSPLQGQEDHNCGIT